MKYLMVAVAGFLLIPSVSYASTLTPNQVSAIIQVLQAFGVNQSTIDIVYSDLVPAPAAPVVEPSGTFAPIQTTTPTFGSVQIAQATSTPVVAPCDDTPTISVKSVDGQSTSFVMASSSYLEFIVSADSACGSSFLIDEKSPSQPQQNHRDSPSGTRGQSFYFTATPPGDYQVSFVAHDGKTTATSTANVVVN